MTISFYLNCIRLVFLIAAHGDFLCSLPRGNLSSTIPVNYFFPIFTISVTDLETFSEMTSFETTFMSSIGESRKDLKHLKKTAFSAHVLSKRFFK